jgi:N-acetylglucosaminyldiphosphoundecaprenol N-acetyl-beta-D-mannosaminyltransferase
VDLVLGAIDERRGGLINTMNVDHLRRFVGEEGYAAGYSKASIVTADGMPLIWASRLRGTPLPERVTGSSLIWSLSEAAAQRGRSIYLLGGSPGLAQKAAQVLAGRYPGLHIAGVSSGPAEFTSDERAWEQASRELTGSRPDIVYVALSSPRSEQLIDRLRHRLPGAWWLGVGAAFSFAAGEVPRAPLWMQRSGLEWVHRLMQEPTRLAKRYLLLGLPFAVTLLGRSALERFAAQKKLRHP